MAATPYSGQVDLGEVVVVADIDDLTSHQWVGTMTDTQPAPPPSFAPGPLLAMLLDEPYEGWVAAAEVDAHGVLLGHAPFVPDTGEDPNEAAARVVREATEGR